MIAEVRTALLAAMDKRGRAPWDHRSEAIPLDFPQRSATNGSGKPFPPAPWVAARPSRTDAVPRFESSRSPDYFAC